jgi:hypothetical protein
MWAFRSRQSSPAPKMSYDMQAAIISGLLVPSAADSSAAPDDGSTAAGMVAQRLIASQCVRQQLDECAKDFKRKFGGCASSFRGRTPLWQVLHLAPNDLLSCLQACGMACRALRQQSTPRAQLTGRRARQRCMVMVLLLAALTATIWMMWL